MTLLTPPLTPKTYPSLSSAMTGGTGGPTPSFPRHYTRRTHPTSPLASPDAFILPPPMEISDLDIPEATLPPTVTQDESSIPMPWRPDMSAEEKDAREAWIAGGRGRKGLRIVIVTENFLPKVDGVTRTLARLLEHLEREGHSCMLLGPGTGMSHYASHPLVGTAGVPLVVYPGLKLNFLRPKFLRTIRDFQPDVVHFVDPIWLGAQTLVAMELGWAGEDWVGRGGPAIGTGISGAVVASYHTNLATYATLFGMAWLEPIMWRFQRWLYSKTLLTLCPSPSTRNMLESNTFSGVRLWPRGVDLSQFGPSKRCAKMRAHWGVGDAPIDINIGTHHSGRKSSLPLTPPASPVVAAANAPTKRIVLLYVGRVSWEKNLVLLLKAYGRLASTSTDLPKLVFVGDGPARTELESICQEEGYDAVFMGHRSGTELAACYASADVFAFPSFTETFGQVVLEALASGLPVVGLDAEGTRDLVSHEETGLLLSPPAGTTAASWPTICRNTSHPQFEACVEGYAGLLARAAGKHSERVAMGIKASTDGIQGFTWWDAMEACVDGYRESIRTARKDRKEREAESVAVKAGGPAPRISRVNRVFSRRLAHRGEWVKARRLDTSETLWHLKNLAKIIVVVLAWYYIWSRHLASRGREPSWNELLA